MKFLRLLPLLFLGACTTDALVEIQSSRFSDMITRGDIKNLVLVKNEEVIEITLKAEALNNAIYKQELERSSPFGISPNGPHYKMKIGSIDKFLDKYEEITQELPREQQVDLQVEERVSGPDTSALVPLLVLLAGGIAWLVARRRPKRAPGNDVSNVDEAKGSVNANSASRYRYPALRTIAGIYMVVAWLLGVCVLIAAVVATYMISGWAAGLIILVGGLMAIGLAAVSEGIRVFLDIEFNTRTNR